MNTIKEKEKLMRNAHVEDCHRGQNTAGLECVCYETTRNDVTQN
jgi:hypothetical protein